MAMAMSMAMGMGITNNYLLPRKSFRTHQPFSLSENSLNSIRFTQRNCFSANPSSVTQPKNNHAIVSSGNDKQQQRRQPPKATNNNNTEVSSTSTRREWEVDSWKKKKAHDQLPEYPNKEELESVLQTLHAFPPIVLAGEARNLEERLGEAAMGNAFLLQGGDCSESFNNFNANNIRDTYRLLLLMASVLSLDGQIPVVKVGRIAGQFARHNFTDPVEKRGCVRLPSYRGDSVNGEEFDLKTRTPEPQRLIRAYFQSASTLNLLRAFAGYASVALPRIIHSNFDFTDHTRQPQQQQLGDRFSELANILAEAIRLKSAAGFTMDHDPTIDFWTSHECLHLPYEQSLTRLDSTSGLYYDCSAHMLWVGERTHQLDGAHVEFLRGVANPLGIKVSHMMDPIELVKLIEILNPQNKAGRITIITRMGAVNMRLKLPHLIRAVRGSDQIVTWVTDPVHGNTHKSFMGPLRTFDAISKEVSAFFDVHEQEGSHPGGVHLAMTGRNMAECVRESKISRFDELTWSFSEHRELRLNDSRCLELASIIADRFSNKMSL